MLSKSAHGLAEPDPGQATTIKPAGLVSRTSRASSASSSRIRIGFVDEYCSTPLLLVAVRLNDVVRG